MLWPGDGKQTTLIKEEASFMDNKKIIEILNKIRVEELTAIMQYSQHHYLAKGINLEKGIRNYCKLIFDSKVCRINC